jgi:hypothetical protein
MLKVGMPSTPLFVSTSHRLRRFALALVVAGRAGTASPASHHRNVRELPQAANGHEN